MYFKSNLNNCTILIAKYIISCCIHMIKSNLYFHFTFFMHVGSTYFIQQPNLPGFLYWLTFATILYNSDIISMPIRCSYRQHQFFPSRLVEFYVSAIQGSSSTNQLLTLFTSFWPGKVTIELTKNDNRKRIFYKRSHNMQWNLFL